MVTVGRLPKKPTILFWNPNVRYHATKCQPPVPIPNQLNSVHFVLNYFFNIDFNIILLPNHRCGPGSSVGIATDYGLDGP